MTGQLAAKHQYLAPVRSEAGEKIRVRLDDLAQSTLENLHEPWADLAAHPAEPNPFLEPLFFTSAFAFTLQEQKAFILSMWSGADLIGFLPLKKSFGYGGLPIPFGADCNHPYQFLSTPLVRKGYERIFAEELLERMRTGPAWLHTLVLAIQVADGPVLAALQDVAQTQGCIFRLKEIRERPLLRKGQVSALTKRRSKKLMNKRERLSELGSINYEELAPEESVEPWLEDFLLLEHKGWKGAANTSIASDASQAEFFRKVAIDFHNKGRLRFARLQSGARTIASFIDLVSGQTLFAFKSAYDPDFGKFSPGVLLDYLGLESFLDTGAYEWMDSCAEGPHPVLSKMWPDSRTLCTAVVSRRNLFTTTGLKTAFLLQSIRTKLKQTS